MSLWGNNIFALNTYFLFFLIFFIYEECLVATNKNLFFFNQFSSTDRKACHLTKFSPIGPGFNTSSSYNIELLNKYNSKQLKLLQKDRGLNENKQINRIKADSRIGPHNKNIISIIFGSLLGDGYAEFRSKGKGTRIRFYQEYSHLSYILWLHKYLAELGYCNPTVPKINTRLGQKGVVRKIIRFNTWTYSSFNWIQELWYHNETKVVPSNIGEFLDPLGLSI